LPVQEPLEAGFRTTQHIGLTREPKQGCRSKRVQCPCCGGLTLGLERRWMILHHHLPARLDRIECRSRSAGGQSDIRGFALPGKVPAAAVVTRCLLVAIRCLRSILGDRNCAQAACLAVEPRGIKAAWADLDKWYGHGCLHCGLRCLQPNILCLLRRRIGWHLDQKTHGPVHYIDQYVWHRLPQHRPYGKEKNQIFRKYVLTASPDRRSVLDGTKSRNGLKMNSESPDPNKIRRYIVQ